MNTPKPAIMSETYVSSPSNPSYSDTPLSYESEWSPESDGTNESEGSEESESEESPESPESPNSSIKSAYGFHPRPRVAGDLIPNQAAFVLLVEIFIQDINKSAVGEERVRMVAALFTFLLQPQFAAYHLGHKTWRRSVLNKSAELLMDHNATSEIRILCHRFQELYGKA
jgi:hypothetical protein